MNKATAPDAKWAYRVLKIAIPLVNDLSHLCGISDRIIRRRQWNRIGIMHLALEGSMGNSCVKAIMVEYVPTYARLLCWHPAWIANHYVPVFSKQ